MESNLGPKITGESKIEPKDQDMAEDSLSLVKSESFKEKVEAYLKTLKLKPNVLLIRDSIQTPKLQGTLLDQYNSYVDQCMCASCKCLA